MFAMLKTKKKKKKRIQKIRFVSPTLQSLFEIIEEMVEKNKTYSYDEITEMMFGVIEDKWRKFYIKAMLSRCLTYLRRKYKIHIYQVNKNLVLLRTDKQFNAVIDMQIRRIKNLDRVIRTLRKDRDDPKYNKKVIERLEKLRERIK